VWASDLPAGTTGTGRVHPRRAAGTGRRIFFFKTVLYPSHTCARRGDTGMGYGYRGTRAHGSAGRERDGSAGQTL
jgi:hypothetical protein